MDTLKDLAASGPLRAPTIPWPLKTCLFFKYGGVIRDSWSFFARNSGDDYRDACVNSIVAGGGNSIIALLSNGDPRAPVSFFEDEWGGHLDLAQVGILVAWARKICAVSGAFFPVFLCDGDESAHIRNAWGAHDRAIGVLATLLRPYCPAFGIGLESSEYFNCAQHNALAETIRHYAPDRYVVTHLQSTPTGGFPKIDAVLWEHPWDPNKGDEHTPEECVSAAQSQQRDWNKIIWPVEYNYLGNRIKAQSEALIAAGFGCGGPV